MKSVFSYPDLLESPITMDANQSIPLFQGEFILESGQIDIRVDGLIEYKWFPHKGVVFCGHLPWASADAIKAISSIETFDAIVEGFVLGKCFVSGFTVADTVTVKGQFQFSAITGDETIAVEKLKFCVPNLKAILGEPVQRITKTSSGFSKSRLTLNNDEYSIVIDKCFDYNESVAALHEKGGYAILYSGELKRAKGILTYENSRDILHCLNVYLSFINGKRTGALFIHGIFGNRTIWSDYSNYYVDTYDELTGWLNVHSVEGLNGLWRTFSKRWKNKTDKHVLVTIVHWYLECNKSSGFVEGSIIMAQTALELLYNWHVVEGKRLLLGKDAENIAASNKIRLLISQMNLDYGIPKRFAALQKFLKSEKLADAPDAIVQIRNAIVHSQEEKRIKLGKIENAAKSEALELSLWYIEVALLKILGFSGKYHNRCSENLTRSAKVENLP